MLCYVTLAFMGQNHLLSGHFTLNQYRVMPEQNISLKVTTTLHRRAILNASNFPSFVWTEAFPREQKSLWHAHFRESRNLTFKVETR